MNAFNYTTHSKQVLGDLHTPVSIYLKVRDMYPQSALMESSDYHAGENSLSFIALCPLASIGINSGIVTTTYPDNTRREEPLSQSFRVENALNRFINRFHVEGDDKKFCGLYGYTTFNAVKYFEHIPVKESHDEQNDAPDLLYILYKYIIVFNHFKNELTLVEMLAEGEESNLSQLESAIENRNFASYNFSVTGPVTSTITDEEHKANVRKGIAHCLRGDVFQIVLSRRFIQPYAGDDFKVYRALRSINPSPYLFYFDFGVWCRQSGRYTPVRFPLCNAFRRLPHLRLVTRNALQSVDKGLERICSVVQDPADSAHQMDDMAVVLGFFVEYYPYVVAIPAEIVACQVHQHYMFCVFFRISQKSFRQFLVFDGVSRAACGAGNRVDIRTARSQ